MIYKRGEGDASRKPVKKDISVIQAKDEGSMGGLEGKSTRFPVCQIKGPSSACSERSERSGF